MKPLYLEISAFGAFGGIEKIDFKKIPNGLFLIYGETGAGKTTIFDAVSYALFGKMSGSIRDTKSARSDFAEESARTYVNFKFLYKDKVYEITRSPSCERRKTTGDGTTKEKGRVLLTLPDGTVLSEEKAVRAEIAGLLALNYSQWKQIAMIAQGEFTKCIHADSGERSAIFRSIFETGIYERLSSRLKSEELAAKRRCEALLESIFQYIDGIVCGEDSPHYQAFSEAKLNRTPEGVIKANRIAVKLTEDAFSLHKALSEDCAAIQKLLDEKNKAIENAKIINRNISELQNERRKKERLLEGESKTKEKEAFVQKAEDAIKELNMLSEQITAHEAAILAKSVIDERANKLSLAREEFQKIVLNKAEAMEKQAQNQLLLEKHKYAGIRHAEHSGELDKARAAILELNATLDEINRYNELRAEYTDMRSRCRKKEKAYKDKEAKLTEKRVLFIKGYSGIIAGELTESEPCPVCGSTSHPLKASKVTGAPTEEELNRLEKEASLLQSEWRKAEAGLEGKQAKGTETKRAILKNAKKYIDLDTEEAVLHIQEKLLTEKKKYEESADILKREAGRLKSEEKIYTEAENRQREEAKLIESLNALEKRKEEEINLIKTGIAQKEGEYGEIKKRLEHDTKEDVLRRIKNILDELGLSEQSAVKAYEAVNFALSAAKRDIESYKNSVIQADAKIDALTRLIGGRELIDLSEMSEEAERLSALKNEKENEKTGKWALYAANSSLLAKIAEGASVIEAEENRYGMIERLSKTANGELKGKQKITLEMYVQRAYFHKILRAANARLRKMTNGRFELLRKQSAANLRDKSFALDLDVLDNYTGRIRDVSSLSGGETFMAALALALALSDTIQAEAGGVEIQTMFIDEGFGSLSPEFLNQVIETLNAMAEGAGNDKLIGVISHVEALRSGISKQLCVTRADTGGSRINRPLA